MFGNDHHHTFKTIASFLVVIFAFSLFTVFYKQADSIVRKDNITMLFLLVGALFAGLLTLVYFINKPNPHHTKKSAKKKSSK